MKQNSYELVLVVDPTLETSHSDAYVDSVANLIKDQKGAVEKIDRWGRKQLAFNIKNFSDGVYSIIKFSGSPESIETINNNLKLNERVIRHMIVKLESS